MAGFEDLSVWQRGVDLSVDLYIQTKDVRDFGFRDQLTRSGLSIPSNIAEGMERSSAADQCKFLEYARSSSGEARTQMIVGSRVGFLPSDVADRWIQESREISSMLQGLINKIRSRS